MKNVLKHPKGLLLVGWFVIVISALAWQTDDNRKKDNTNKEQPARDTTTPRQHHVDEYKLRELDEAMRNLDSQMKNLNLNLKNINVDVTKEVNEALASIDFDEIGKNIQAQLKEIDFDKINLEVQNELKKIDMKKISEEVNQSLNEAKEEIKNIDMEKLQSQMKEMQLKLNSADLQKQINGALQNAQKEIDKAKRELQELKDFTSDLQKDGLIDKKKGYTIEWTKDGDLIINGKTQPKEISDKYSRYYKKDGYKIKIRPDEDLDTEEF